MRKLIGALLVLALSQLSSGCKQEYSLVQQAKSVPSTESGGGGNIPTDICDSNPTADACNKKPVVTTPGVVTILFTMSQIPENAGALIVNNAIKYASPVQNPKILFLKDDKTNGEDEGDPQYIKDTLLATYNAEYDVIPSGGLEPSRIKGYDLVIVSNPGYPLSVQKTLDTLIAYKGGVILMGDDLAQGNGFTTEALTGLIFGNNGTSMSCNGQTYGYDNNSGYNYQISINEAFLPGIPDQYKNYQYGNDIDWTAAKSGVQVLAWASAASGTCDIGKIPAVARKQK